VALASGGRRPQGATGVPPRFTDLNNAVFTFLTGGIGNNVMINILVDQFNMTQESAALMVLTLASLRPGADPSDAQATALRDFIAWVHT
jgi:hypothetical protein